MKFTREIALRDWKNSFYFISYGGLGTSWTWLFANEYWCLIKDKEI